MSEKEIYRYDIVIDVNNEEAARKAKAAEERINKTFDKIEKQGRALKKLEATPTIRLRDRFTTTAKKIETTMHKIGNKTVTVAVKAKDMTGGILGKLTSPLGILGAGAGVYGIGKLTLGQAMDFETQMVSMEHWLKGNKALANDFVGWLDKFAAKTPFEMGDLFPAGSRAIGVSEGDISMAKRLIGLSADMAGLTPGKTVQDAMEALADAQMGEFERMKEFNMKFSKEQMDAAGGFAGFLAQAEKKFNGGAEKLSQTSKGRISTIVDFFKTQFRSAGMGMLEAMQPRLEKIVDWFDKNTDTIAGWKDSLIRFGREGFDWLLSKGERVFERLKKIIDDPGFRNADWGGKVAILLNGMTTSMIDWLAGPGGKALVVLGAGMGKIAGEAFVGAFTGMMMDHPVLRTMAMGYAGGKVGGAPGAVVGGAASIVAEIPITAAKSAERRAEAQQQYIKNQGDIVDQYKANPQAWADKYNVPGYTIGPSQLTTWQKIKGFFGYADGGILTRPHFGMVAEAGPEVIIPLSSQRRDRALDLWEYAGRYLGVKPYEFGGIAGQVPVVADGGGTASMNITVSGVSLSISESEIDEDELALRIGRKIVFKIKKAMENRV